jgi:hypothetical protein
MYTASVYIYTYITREGVLRTAAVRYVPPDAGYLHDEDDGLGELM